MNASSEHPDDRRRVLDATDIVHIVSEHVRLHAKGREFVGLCPFHDDHKPSMYVVPSKQIYHCFSCGAGGNAIDFIMGFHKIEFLEALRLLADRASIALTPRKPGAGDAGSDGRDSRADLRAASAFALEFFRSVYAHAVAGQAARDLAAKRGINAEMVERFSIGAAADSWDGLINAAQKRGFDRRTLVAAGLAKPRDDGGAYDAFRHRLIFPIADATGRPIAFGGRKIRDEDEPKYLNSSESPIFDKSSTLFGLHLASRAIQREGYAVVTEGYTDVIACHQAGFENVVATLGTALTPGHARILRRLCPRVVLLFDGDAAGIKAADRAIEVFFREPIDVEIAALPDGLDPADLLARSAGLDIDGATERPAGAEVFRDCLAGARDALEYRLDRLRARVRAAGLSGRASIIEDELARLTELGLSNQPLIRRSLIVRRLAEASGADEGSILGALNAAERRARSRAASARSRAGVDGPVAGSGYDAAIASRDDARALGALLAEPVLIRELSDSERDILDPGAYAPGPLRSIAETLFTLMHDADATTQGLIDRIADPAARALASGLATRVIEETGGEAERLAAHMRDFTSRALRARMKDASASASPDADVARRIAARREVMRRFGSDPMTVPVAGVVGSRPRTSIPSIPGEAAP